MYYKCIQIYLILQFAFALPLFTKILYRHVLFLKLCMCDIKMSPIYKTGALPNMYPCTSFIICMA